MKDYVAGIYRVERPEAPLPLIFDSPHSGRDYPDDFNYVCPFEMLQKAEDNYVDELFENVPAAGGTLLTALFPRTYIDVNRAATDIDPDMLDGTWPDAVRPTARSRAGTGLIRRKLRMHTPVYDRKLSIKDIKQRIDNFYKPYHDTLAGLLAEAHSAHGQVWHINCHSMPATQPDFCIGDYDGRSCDRDFTYDLRDFLKNLGYNVALNHPYKGVEILRRYGAPAQGRHSIQMEISKALYWNSESGKKMKNYNELKENLEKMVSFCAAWVTDRNAIDLAAD